MSFNCECSCLENKVNSSYIKWILEILGPVILGSKPCEILNISSNDCLKEEKINNIDNFFKDCFRISYKFINICDGSVRIIFFNKKSLKNVFSNKKCTNFLKFLGYPSYNCVDDYVDILVSKLHSNDFPHEIGIFLGYPLKDVLGFMGYGKYEFFETKSWKIYGNPTDSYKTYNSFIHDRNKMKNLIKTNSLDILRNAI